MTASALVLASARSGDQMSRRFVLPAFVKAFGVALVWVFMLLAALGLETAVIVAIHTAVRVLYVDIPTQKYDASHFARR